MDSEEILELINELMQNQLEIYKSENGNLSSQLTFLRRKDEQLEPRKKEIDELKTLVNTLVANQTGQGNKE